MQFTEITSYLGAGSTLPGLLNEFEASRVTGIDPERLVELADGGFAPCVRIDKGPPKFFKKDIVSWVKAYLFRVQPGKIIAPVAVVLEDPRAAHLDLPLSLSLMADSLREYKALSAIYFLVKNKEVVYVGQSVNLSARLTSHGNDREFQFDKAFYMAVPASELNEVESYFIHTMSPAWNTQRPSKTRGDELVSRLTSRFTRIEQVENNA